MRHPLHSNGLLRMDRPTENPVSNSVTVLLRSNVLLVTMEIKSTSRCIATDICRLSLMGEAPTQLWGTVSTSNMEILKRFQSKVVRMIVDALWYVTNTVFRRDLRIPTVKDEIRRCRSQYSARLCAHPNYLIVNLIELPDNRRLRRHLPNDLPTTFLMYLFYL
jgi:hypothetical protein